MAPAKRGTTKPEVKAVETAVKTTAPKTEEKAAVKETVKTEEKKAAVPAAAPAAAAKAVAEKVVESAKKKAATKKTAGRKSAVKKAEPKASVCIQFSGKSYSEEDLVKMAKDVWKFDLKQKLADLTSVELYVKPEENTVYYVMNKDYAGSFYI